MVMLEKQTCSDCGKVERVAAEFRGGKAVRPGWKVPVTGCCMECGCTRVVCVMEDPGGLLVALDRKGEGACH